MTPEAMAALHAECFTTPPPWSAEGFRSLLASPGVFAHYRPQGFILGRVTLDEAELLTLAVSPRARRQGIGAALLEMFENTARVQRAASAFLEVASDNTAARALYQRAGWAQIGLRRGYYAPGLDAVVMRKALTG